MKMDRSPRAPVKRRYDGDIERELRRKCNDEEYYPSRSSENDLPDNRIKFYNLRPIQNVPKVGKIHTYNIKLENGRIFEIKVEKNEPTQRYLERKMDILLFNNAVQFVTIYEKDNKTVTVIKGEIMMNEKKKIEIFNNPETVYVITNLYDKIVDVSYKCQIDNLIV